ncbi:MAG TPA: hypothetical protein DCG48_13320 [Rhodospirillaceae bacterium]|nr:hypothetical protein [Rhodospirillaceae bacterium]
MTYIKKTEKALGRGSEGLWGVVEVGETRRLGKMGELGSDRRASLRGIRANEVREELTRKQQRQ